MALYHCWTQPVASSKWGVQPVTQTNHRADPVATQQGSPHNNHACPTVISPVQLQDTASSPSQHKSPVRALSQQQSKPVAYLLMKPILPPCPALRISPLPGLTAKSSLRTYTIMKSWLWPCLNLRVQTKGTSNQGSDAKAKPIALLNQSVQPVAPSCLGSQPAI